MNSYHLQRGEQAKISFLMEEVLPSLSLANFLVQSPALLFIANHELHILVASHALELLLGCKLAGRQLLDLVPEAARAEASKSCAAAIAGEARTEVCLSMHAEGGKTVALKGVLQSGQGESATAIFGTLWPAPSVPEVKPAPAAVLSAASTYLEVISEHLPIVLTAIDPAGTFIYHEGKALAAVGLKPRQFLGLNIFTLYPAETLTYVRSALKGEATHSISEAHGTSWENWFLPVRSEDGEIVAAVGCSIDISENVRKEKELKERLDTIQEQQHIIQSLSTPILQIWDQVLTLPLFGHVDSTRASALMESLLHEVVRTRTRFAILDLTGVDVIDTATAGHLMSLIRALKLLGTEGIITGIKASIAQTVVSLGSDLSGITTLSTLQAGLQYCIEQLRAPSRSMTAASPRR